MLVNNIKIYTPRYNYTKNPPSRNQQVTVKSSCKNEISNICYHPFFTGKEMSDAEFATKKQSLENLYNFSQNQDNEFLKDIFDNCNKSNINLATTLLTDRSIDKLRLDIPEILLYASDDNSEFIEKICRDKNFPPGLIIRILPLLKKENIPFANIVYNENEFQEMEDLLDEFNRDKISGICTLLNSKLLNYTEDYPQDTINEIKNIYHISDDIDIFEQIYNDDIPTKQKFNIFESISEKSIPILKHMYNNPQIGNMRLISNLFDYDEKFDLFEGKENIEKLIHKLYYQQNLCLKNPEKYTNSRIEDITYKQNLIKAFFGQNFVKIMLAVSVLDKECTDVLFRKRTAKVKEYIEQLSTLPPNSIKTLRELVNSNNIDGKPFLPTQKIDFLKLIYAYRHNKMPLSKIDKMIKIGKVDTSELYSELLREIIQKSGNFSDNEINSIPPEKLFNWDYTKIHLLASEIEESDNPKAFQDVIKAATLDKFHEYILDTTNLYGEKNKETQKLFSIMKLDYQKWINPSPANNVNVYIKNSYLEKVLKIQNDIEGTIEALRKTDPKVKNYIDKILQPYITNDKFYIPKENLTSKKYFEHSISNIINDLNKVWDRANNNYETYRKKYLLATSEDIKYEKENESTINKDQYPYSNENLNELNKRAAKAAYTLTLKQQLDNALCAIKKLDPDLENPELNLTIKMWDRIPQKDLFQGNYSTCCIAMGGQQGKNMPHYLLNTAFNMIEIVNNETGKTIGNALCYWVRNSDDRPALVIDNVEINNAFEYKQNDKIGQNIRNAIKQYAQNIAKDVSNNPECDILLGTNYNDIPTSDLKIQKERIGLIGYVSSKSIYLDVFLGNTNTDSHGILYKYPAQVYKLSNSFKD